MKELFNDQCIAIIGAGLLQTPAIEKAEAFGAQTVVLDADPHAPGVSKASYFVNCSTMDAESAAQALISFSRKVRPVDAVFTVGTDASYTVALCAQALSLPGISPLSAQKATNKQLMRESLKAAGIKVPVFAACSSLEEALDTFPSMNGPCVIKPLRNMGARGVRRVDNLAGMEEAWRESFPYSKTGKMLIEQYIEGPELSIDALIWQEEVSICGIADRVIQYPPYFVETGHIMPSSLAQDLQDMAVMEMKAAIKALGLTTGAAKGDVKVNEQGAWIGELAARLSGGFMSAYTYPLSSGVDLISNAMAIALGHPPFDLEAKRTWTSIEQAIMAEPGTVTEIQGISQARAIPGVDQLFLDVSIGDKVLEPRNNLDKCGHIITAAPTFEEALRVIDSAQNIIRIVTKKEV